MKLPTQHIALQFLVVKKLNSIMFIKNHKIKEKTEKHFMTILIVSVSNLVSLMQDHHYCHTVTIKWVWPLRAGYVAEVTRLYQQLHKPTRLAQVGFI